MNKTEVLQLLWILAGLATIGWGIKYGVNAWKEQDPFRRIRLYLETTMLAIFGAAFLLLGTNM